MPKMSQVLGIERATRARVHRDVTTLVRIIDHPELFAGLVRTYKPVDDQGEQLPAETQRVQHKGEDILLDMRRLESDWFDTVATKEWGNTKTRADIKVGDELILADVPVGFLLFLQKRLDDLLTFLRRMPQLDPTEEWDMDRANGYYRSAVVQSQKMKKVPRSLILVEATERHPAQAETFHEDIVIGYWDRIRYSGALSGPRVDDLIRRTVQLRDAVIAAREEANSIEVTKQEVASPLLGYIFG